MPDKEHIYDDIKTMKGIDIIRKRPGQFVGSPRLLDGQKNSEALLQLYQEILSNSIDEAYAGYGNKITLIIHKDNSMTVADHGRGMPKGKDFDKVIRALTVLYSSNKYDASDYAQSIGQNGVGIKATNALSDWLELEAQNQAGDHYYIKVHMQEILEKKDLPYDESLGTFTTITFLPDTDYFKGHIDWDKDIVVDKIKKSSYLTPKVHFVLIDERDDTKEDFYSENGLIDYLQLVTQGEEYLVDPISFNRKFDDMNVEGAVAFVNSAGTNIYSFANGVETVDGGPHVTGYKKAVYNAIDNFAKNKGFLKKSQRLVERDVLSGLVGTVLVKLPEDKLLFNSQSKTKLTSPEANKITKEAVYDILSEWLYDHVDEGWKLVDNILATTEAQLKLENEKREMKEAKDAIREAKKKVDDPIFISKKLIREINKRAKSKELYIVEGDSAAGSARASRSENQAIFPIRGKIKNVFWQSINEALTNEEVSTIMGILGAGIGSEYDDKKLKYDKIVIASDADADGSHIQSLLSVLFWKFFPDLIRNGHLYIANAPLYRITRYEGKKQINEYVYSDAERDEIVNKWKSKRYSMDITRFKGLGESSADELGPAIMDHDTRHLTKLTIPDVDHMKAVNDAMTLTMGVSDEVRKQWMMENLKFNMADYD